MARSVTRTLRPDVPMQMFTCIPQVAAMGVVHALREEGVEDAALAWPSSVSVGGRKVACVEAHAGYDGSPYATCELVVDGDGPSLSVADDVLGRAIEGEVASWEEALGKARAVAGPLAPVLEEYFSLLDCANAEVEVVYSNGRVAATGVLAGMDVWGRAAVRTGSGRVLDVSPEQAGIRRAC